MLFKLGWRNIWRNKRRSILTILAIAFATFLTVAFEGMTIGTWEYSVSNSVELFSGYLQIQKQGFQENPSLNKNFAFPGKVADCINNVPNIIGFAPRIQTDGLISFRDNSSGTAIIGIDPQAEVKLSRFQDRIRKGRMIRQDGLDEMVVGITLLKNLSAEIGDTVVLLAQGYDGVMGNQKFQVVGAMKFGTAEIDATMILLHYQAAQELLAMNGLVNIVVIGTQGLQMVENVHDTVQESLQRHGLNHLSILTWSEVMPELKQGMDLDKINHSIFMAILVIVVAFGVMNTVLMSITERFREFGITLALGMQSSGLVKLVLIETIFISLVGIAIGGIIGHCVNLYFYYHPILLGGNVGQLYEEYGFLPMIIPTIRLSVPFIATGLIFLLCCLASLYPLYRVQNLEPLKGIRHT
jgi:ABC-type lipoprotein release transport system permease subunit